MKKTFAILVSLLSLLGCKRTEVLLPNVSGKAGEVIVVIEKDHWEGALGESVRDLLAKDCPYLAQKEPLYSLVNVTPNAFADLFKVHRNIVFFNVAPDVDSTRIILGRNIWAKPQCVVQVNAKDQDAAVRLVESSGEKIATAIEQAERDRVIANSIRYEELGIRPKVNAVFGGSARFPMGYKLRKVTDDFAWVADDKQYTMQDILIYRYPATEAEPFTKENIISHRNEILKANVPGMFENTWMTTSNGFPVTVAFRKYHGREFAETRGYWEVENDYMGGPFVSQSFYSKDGEYIIVMDAFVYAPKFDKRQYLRQVESILYSWEWE